MNGTPAIVQAVRRILEQGGSGVLATVVRVRGSAYRRPGARMFFPDPSGGRPAEPMGMVSGGCLEADLAERAQEVARSGRSTHVVYDMRSPDDIVWGLGLGCDGEIRVLLERVHPGELPADLVWIEDHAQRREPMALATRYEAATESAGESARPIRRFAVSGSLGGRAVHGAPEPVRAALEQALSTGERGEVEPDSEGDGSRWCVDYVAPPIRLWVFGAGLDALPMVTTAAGLDWTVELFDHRPAMLQPERFSAVHGLHQIDPASWSAEVAPPADRRTAALLMTHHFLNDLALLRTLIPLPLGYLGVLGPQKRRAHLFEELGEGSPPGAGRVHGPVGLNIGAETPEEIAVSAISEIQAVLQERDGGFLTDRDAPLH